MPVTYFHCTDGIDLILDRTGRAVPPRRDAMDVARTVADEVMRAVPGYREWQAWAVHIYDEGGQIDIVPFEDLGAGREPSGGGREPSGGGREPSGGGPEPFRQAA